MKKLNRLMTHHWQAKVLSFLLALLVWAVARKSIEATGSHSKSSAETKFDISTRR
jgi:YbbR domain-containing protein